MLKMSGSCTESDVTEAVVAVATIVAPSASRLSMLELRLAESLVALLPASLSVPSSLWLPPVLLLLLLVPRLGLLPLLLPLLGLRW